MIDQSQHFCDWQIRQTQDLIIGIALVTISLVLCFKIIYHLITIFRSKWINDKTVYKQIYILLSLWALSHCSKLMFGIIGYINFSSQTIDSKRNIIQNYSHYFCVVDCLSVIFLHWTILLIPYIWIRQISISLDRNGHPAGLFLKIVKKVLLVYLFGRLIIYLVLIILQLSSTNNDSKKMYRNLLNIVLLVQATIIVLFLGIGLIILLNKVRVLNWYNPQDSKKIIIEYTMLMGIQLTRFIFDLVFLVQLSSAHDCDFLSQYTTQSKWVFSFVYLMLGTLLTHTLPILLINLKIYKIIPKKLDQTLLCATNN